MQFLAHTTEHKLPTGFPWKKTSCSPTVKPSCASIICFSLKTVKERWIRKGNDIRGVPSSMRTLGKGANMEPSQLLQLHQKINSVKCYKQPQKNKNKDGAKAYRMATGSLIVSEQFPILKFANQSSVMQAAVFLLAKPIRRDQCFNKTYRQRLNETLLKYKFSRRSSGSLRRIHFVRCFLNSKLI